MSGKHPNSSRQGGVALVTSLLLLVIITILALSMFRSFGTQERIAGNMREKERALHAANSAQQYAEWWLLQNGNAIPGASVSCSGIVAATPTQGQICNTTPLLQLGPTWISSISSTGWLVGMSFIPDASMTFVTTGTQVAGTPPYYSPPMYWITDLGIANDTLGEAYQIDAYGYGSAANTVALVESFYEVSPGVQSLTGP